MVPLIYHDLNPALFDDITKSLKTLNLKQVGVNSQTRILGRLFLEKIFTADQIISPKYKRATGKEVWRENLRTTIYAADKIRSNLGPKGAYKLITYNRGPEKVIKITK